MPNSRLPMPSEIIDIMSKNEAKVEWMFDPGDPSVLIRFNILDSTFAGATLKIPDNVTKIRIDTTNNNRNKSKIKKIIIPESVIIIGNYAFYNCTSLQTINLPSDVTNIGFYAFYNCAPLQTINLPSSLTSIGEGAFYDCTSLQTINLPSSLTSIGPYAFYDCASLQTINLQSDVTNIGPYAFERCISLQTINLPSSLTSISSNAFHNCTSLQFVTIENGFNCNFLNLSSSANYSAETIVSWLEALADRTGETAYTLTIGTTNLNKLTDEQIAIATNKNWNLA